MAEGSSVQVKVTLDADPERTVIIPIVKTDQAGATSDDYSSVPTTVTFTSGEMEQTFTFTAASDDVDDDDESVRLGFGATLPTGVSAGIIDEATVSITDDDVPSVSVSFEQATYTVAEGSSVQVKVTLDADPERTVTIPLTVTDQGGATSDDYSSVPTTVTFTSGETEQTFTFTAASDDVDDDDESVRLGFGATLPTGVNTGSTNETTISITDDDVPSVSVSFEQSTYTVAEGSSVQVKVTLDADPERTITIPIVKTEQGGATASDYSGVQESVVFSSGETEQTFTFTAASDDVDDDGESIKLGFGATLPTGVSAGDPNEATVSITDDDVPSVSVSFEQSTYTVAEGSSVQVKVTLDADPERTVTIPLTSTDQDGATSDDYSSVPTDVTFDDGETEQTLTFEAAADSDNDDGESIKLGFGSTLPTGVNTGSTNETTISITDDDVPQVVVSFQQATYTVAEGSSVQVKVTLDADPERTVTIPLTATDQGGATASDYSDVPETVTITSGETEQTFTFTAASDDVDDDGESIKLGFGATLPTGVSTGTPSETTVSITDDDDPSVSVSFEQATYTVAEGSSVQVKVTLDADPERTVTIPLTATDQGGATASDYSDVPETVTITSGETEQTFTFTAASDDVDDDDESVKLGFGATLPTGVSGGTIDETTVSITDDDVPSVSVSFEQSTYTVAEGSSVQVKVTLDADPERTITIPIVKTEQGGATASDYSGVQESVVFSSGETEQTFTLTAAADDVDDDGESVKLTFGTLPTDVIASSIDETTISITDDDTTGVSIDPTDLEVDEGSTATYTVALDTEPTAEVTITVSGHSGTDVSLDKSTLTFTPANWNVAQTVTLTAGDVAVTTDLALSHEVTGSGEYAAVTADDVNVTVLMNQAGVTVSFEKEDHPTIEGAGGVSVALVLSAALESAVNIPITVSSQSTAGAGDYSELPTTVTFVQGETLTSFPVHPLADTEDENDEQVVLAFGTLPDGVGSGEINQTTVTILDAVRVSFDASSYEATEGGADAVVTVQLNEPAPHDMTVPLTAEGRNGADESDWSGVLENVVFNTGDTSKSFTVVAVDDAVEDDDEMVALGFGTLPGGLVAAPPATATLTIMNQENGQPSEDKCDSAIWCATVTFGNLNGSSHAFSYHPRNTDSSMSKDHFTYKGTKYSFMDVRLVAYTEDYYEEDVSGPPFNVPGFSYLDIGLGAGSHDWETASRWQVSLDQVADWTLYLDDIELPFSGVEIYGGISSFIAYPGGFLWHSAEFSTFDNMGSNGDGKYIMRIEAKENTGVNATTNADTVGPKFVSGEVRNDEVTLIFNEELSSEPLPHPKVIYVEYEEIHHEITELQVDGKKLLLTLDKAIGWGPSIWIHHIDMPVKSHAPIRDLYGNRAPFFIDKYLTNLTPSEPRWPEVFPLNDGGLRVTWIPPLHGKGSPIMKYKVQWKEQAADNWDPLDVADAASLHKSGRIGEESYSIAADDLTCCVPHTVRIIAVHRAGDGPPSDEVTATPKPKPASLPAQADDPERANSPATGVPGITGTPFAGQTLTVDTSDIADEDGLDNVTFTYQWLILDGTTETEIPDSTGSAYTLTEDDQGKAIKVRVTFTDDAGNEETLTSHAVLGMALTTSNSPATGAPTISGTAQVGEQLTADTTGIADEDGLENAVFGYQWLADDANIQGATDSSYTLADSDEGKAIKVRVSFTDDATNAETLTSAPTVAVAAAPVPLTVNLTVAAPATHDGSAEFTFEIEFSEEFDLSYVTLRDHAFTVAGGVVEKAQRTAKPSNMHWRITVRPDSNADVTITLPITEDCNAEGAICTEDGRKLSNPLNFTVSGPGG